MKRYIFSSLAVALAFGTADAPGLAQERRAPIRAQLTPEQAADRQVWIDEHARWNAEHMAAARRLEEVAATLKQHNTGFDLHGQELRGHGTGTAGSGTIVQEHPRLRTAHEQARNVHDDLMDAVDVLARVLRKNLGKNQSFPEAPEQP
jgi:hypothetical protein